MTQTETQGHLKTGIKIGLKTTITGGRGWLIEKRRPKVEHDKRSASGIVRFAN